MKRTSIRLLPGLVVGVALASLPICSGAAPLVIHEWGTFTSLQDEAGHAIGGINTDDEPVPAFVHRVYPVNSSTEAPNMFFKGVPRCDTDVTMRLETPVLYFHPSAPVTTPVTVTVKFHGGWLSEFYPQAETTTPGIKNGFFDQLRSSTTGTLAWNNLTLGGDWPGPDTGDRVWTSPRAVEAANVRATNGETERFLFYRGVAHLDAPIAVTRQAGELTLHSHCAIGNTQPLNVNSLWLVDIAADGRLAFRVVPPITLDGEGESLAQISAQFRPDDYSAANREKLKDLMHVSLMQEGLFDDEARALLNTWEVSYFKSSGLRLFFMVPRVWTDSYLPLNVSVPADITRVMVGRIELITPAQRQDLRQIAQTSTNEIDVDILNLGKNFVALLGTNSADRQVPFLRNLPLLLSGKMSLKAAGFSVPNSYQCYLDLGRFRNALILEEARRHRTPALVFFISAYRLAGYTPPDNPPPAVAQVE